MLNGFDLIMYLLGIIALLTAWIRVCLDNLREHGVIVCIMCFIPLVAIGTAVIKWKRYKFSLLLGFIGIVLTGTVQPKVTAAINELRKQKQQELEAPFHSGQDIGPDDVFRSVRLHVSNVNVDGSNPFTRFPARSSTEPHNRASRRGLSLAWYAMQRSAMRPNPSS